MKPEMMTPKITIPIIVPTTDPRPPERHAADDGHGDGVELVHRAHAGLCGQAARRNDDAGKSGEQSGNGVDLDDMTFHIDAGHPCRLRIGADRIGELAVARVPQHDVQDRGDCEEDHNRCQALAECGKAVGREADRLAFRVPLGKAARSDHHAERGDERRDLRIGNEEAVDGTAE